MRERGHCGIHTEYNGHCSVCVYADERKAIAETEPDAVTSNGIKFKHIKTFQSDEPVVEMKEFQGRLFLATSKRCFVFENDEFVQLTFNGDPNP